MFKFACVAVIFALFVGGVLHNSQRREGVELADFMRRCTVKVDMEGSSGSGVIVRRGGKFVFLTAAHVANSSTYFTATLETPQGTTEVWKVTPTVISSACDLAILAPCGECEVPAAAAEISRREPLVGERCFCYSAPYGSLSYTEGFVSRLGQSLSSGTGGLYTKTTQLASPGSSGSGVFNADGQLIGIVSRAIIGEFSLLVPSEKVAEFLAE